MILGTFVWNIAGEVCDARQAKRLFPLFTSAGILGSVIGNAVTGVIARLLGTTADELAIVRNTSEANNVRAAYGSVDEVKG